MNAKRLEKFSTNLRNNCWPDSSVGIATGYGLDAHPASCAMGTGVFPGGKERPGRDADHSSDSSAVVKKEQSYTSTPTMGLRSVQSLSACTRVHFTFFT